VISRSRGRRWCAGCEASGLANMSEKKFTIKLIVRDDSSTTELWLRLDNVRAVVSYCSEQQRCSSPRTCLACASFVAIFNVAYVAESDKRWPGVCLSVLLAVRVVCLSVQARRY